MSPSGEGASFGQGLPSLISSLPPEDGQAAVAEIAPAGHQTEIGTGHLGAPRLSTKLASCFDHMVQAPNVRLRQETAVRVERKLAAELDTPPANEGSALSGTAEPECLELQKHGGGAR